jgi:hypothetical protein
MSHWIFRWLFLAKRTKRKGGWEKKRKRVLIAQGKQSQQRENYRAERY